jgi:type IV pilus assembly protein PilQ
MSKINKSFYRDCVAALLIILLFVSPIAFGVEPASSWVEQRVLTTTEQQLQERVTFTCRNLPIDTVLMQLADQAQVDIIKSPKVQGNVTVKITDVPLDEALNNILAAHNWTYIASENMIRVMPLADVVVVSKKFITSIYKITYADVKEVADALKDFVSSKGKIAYDKGTSHIIITDTESNIKAMDRFIAQIDHEILQVMVEARIYDITSTEAFEIGVEWNAGRNTPLTTITDETSRERIDTDNSPTETTIITDQTINDQISDPAITGDLDDTITTTSTEEPFYEITDEHTVTTKDESWLVVDGVRQPVRRSKPFIGGTFSQGGGGTLTFGLLNDMIDLEIALSMLHSQVEATLLANPRVLVLDNETATIKIVKEIPYTESLQALGVGGLTVARVRFKDVGVQLQVTPHVAREGMIRLKLKPEFGVEATVQRPGDKASSAPAVDTRMLETVALVKDGQTVVMGGLRKKDKTIDISKVPILGDIPLLGGLFRYETENEVTNELVVFITPKIITRSVLTENELKQLEATRFTGPPVSKTNGGRDFTPKLQADESDVVKSAKPQDDEKQG